MKKLLGFLAVAPLTMTSCMIAGSPDGWEGIEKDVQELLDSVSDHTTMLGTEYTSRSQKEDILDILKYTDEYNEDYTLEQLIALPEGLSLTDIKDPSVTDVILTSHGGPTFKAIPNYFEAGRRMTYLASSDASLHGTGASDGFNQPETVNWDRTTYIDANKTWGELGIPATSGALATDYPVDGEKYNIWYSNDKSGNFAPVDYKPSHYNVAAIQAHQLHYDEFRQETKNGLMDFDKTVEFNLRTIAILDAVATKMADEIEGIDLHFLSHSLGAVMSTLYLSTIGFLDERLDDREFKFDTFVTSAGRIKFESEVATAFSQGRGGVFQSDGNGGRTFVEYSEADMVNGLKAEYAIEKAEYDALSTQAEKDEHDALRGSYVGGMTETAYISNLRSGMMMQGHFGSLDNGDIMKTYGGAEKHAYFIHGGYDEATGPLRQDERDVISANWAGESYTAYADHSVQHINDFTFENNLWDIFEPTTAHVEMV